MNTPHKERKLRFAAKILEPANSNYEASIWATRIDNGNPTYVVLHTKTVTGRELSLGIRNLQVVSYFIDSVTDFCSQLLSVISLAKIQTTGFLLI